MSWEKVRLGKYLKVRDTRFKPADKAIADLKRIDKIDFSGEIFLSDKPSNTDMILVKKGDLVISGINVEKGAMAVYSGDEDIIATIHYSAYSYDEREIDIHFLKSFLKSSEFKNALKEQVPGGIKTEIKPKHLLPLLVTIPTDINDQRAVVRLLQERNSKIDAVSTDLTHQLSLVKKLRQQILQDAMQGKLVPQDPNDEPAGELLRKIKAVKAKLIAEKKLKKEKELPPIKQEEVPIEIPEGWVWCRFGSLGDCRLGKMLDGTKNKGEFVKYLRNTNVQWNQIDLDDIKELRLEKHEIEEYKLIVGDLLICEGGVPGRCAIWKGSDEYYSFQKALHRFRSNGSVITEYITYYLEYIYINEILYQYFTGNQIKHLTGQSLEKVLIPLPPLPEQRRIVQKLNELMQTCDALEASIQQSVSLNEKLLQQVLREALR